jgi:hypothetical protein
MRRVIWVLSLIVVLLAAHSMVAVSPAAHRT